MEDRIRLFDAENLEELDRIKVKIERIMEVTEEMRRMRLVRWLRWYYEEWEKAKRDRWAEDEYVRDQGRAEGLAMGIAERKAVGKAEGLAVGKAEAILLILSIKGGVEADLRDKILEESDTDILNDWVMAAAVAEDVEEFRKKIE